MFLLICRDVELAEAELRELFQGPEHSARQRLERAFAGALCLAAKCAEVWEEQQQQRFAIWGLQQGHLSLLKAELEEMSKALWLSMLEASERDELEAGAVHSGSCLAPLRDRQEADAVHIGICCVPLRDELENVRCMLMCLHVFGAHLVVNSSAGADRRAKGVAHLENPPPCCVLEPQNIPRGPLGHTRLSIWSCFARVEWSGWLGGWGG